MGRFESHAESDLKKPFIGSVGTLGAFSTFQPCTSWMCVKCRRLYCYLRRSHLTFEVEIIWSDICFYYLVAQFLQVHCKLVQQRFPTYRQLSSEMQEQALWKGGESSWLEMVFGTILPILCFSDFYWGMLGLKKAHTLSHFLLHTNVLQNKQFFR